MPLLLTRTAKVDGEEVTLDGTLQMTSPSLTQVAVPEANRHSEHAKEERGKKPEPGTVMEFEDMLEPRATAPSWYLNKRSRSEERVQLSHLHRRVALAAPQRRVADQRRPVRRRLQYGHVRRRRARQGRELAAVGRRRARQVRSSDCQTRAAASWAARGRRRVDDRRRDVQKVDRRGGGGGVARGVGHVDKVELVVAHPEREGRKAAAVATAGDTQPMDEDEMNSTTNTVSSVAMLLKR